MLLRTTHAGKRVSRATGRTNVKIKTVGELREYLSHYKDDMPVKGVCTYEGCETCGPFDEEETLNVEDLETRLVFEGND
jgi:hypothetical protein